VFSLFKKIKLFLFYKNQITKNGNYLLQNFNLRIDYIYRMYTVLNIPKELIEEPYNFRSSDINNISQNYISTFSDQLQNFLNSVGLRELVRIYEIKKVDKFSYLLIFGYSLFDTKKTTTRILYSTLFSSILITLISIIYYIIK